MKMKNMRNILLFGFYFVLSLKEVFGESENEIKRGVYPYMAIIYYPDATIVGPSGARFTRSAVVIRTEWLISSSLETNDTRLAFPQKTLVARAGANVIDSNFTFNEDEGEQEREIIQIVRPTSFTSSQWWNNDVTLLKTLVPFIMSPTVALTTLSVKQNYMDKTCSILIFAKKYINSTDDKMLMKLNVELLPSSTENCGINFRNETMICASNSDENKNLIYDPDFCHSNGGGPLVCEGDVIGLQTYIDNSCKHPYLYQLLSAWDDFITCGVEDNCKMPQCAIFCVSMYKDVELVTLGTNEITTLATSETPKQIIIDQPIEDSNDDEHVIVSDTTLPKAMLDNENETPTPTALSLAERTTAKDSTTLSVGENEEKATSTEDSENSWPKEKLVGYRKKLDEAERTENVDRTANVEAQLHEAKKKGRSTADSHIIGKMSLIHNLSFVLLLFICII